MSSAWQVLVALRVAVVVILTIATASCDRSDERSPALDEFALLEEDLRLGSVAGGGMDEFGQVMAIQVDGLGRIYVADGLNGQIRVFGPDGQHVRTLGGKGDGPGEFRMLTGMAWGPGDRLWSMDQRASRLTVFDTAGALARTYARERTLSTTIPWAGGIDSRGAVYDWTTELPTNDRRASRRQLLIRYRPRNDAVVASDTFFFPPVSRIDTFQTRSAQGLRLSSDVPFSSSRRWRLAPDGSIWMGMTGDYRLVRVNLEGDTLATLRREWEPVAVSDAERDSVVAEEHVPADRVPGTKPAFRSFFVDADGRVWVEPYLSDDGTTWDVFSDAGAHLGRVHTPLELEAEAPSPVARDGRLYAVLRDEMDVPFVVRLRIPELAAAGS